MRFLHELFSDNSLLTSRHHFESAAWRSGVERRFYDDHDRKVDGSTPSLVSLLLPRIRCFTIIISARWNLASSKSKKSEAKFKRKTRKKRQLLSEPGFVLSIAPPPLSRDRRIKMKKSNRIFADLKNAFLNQQNSENLEQLYILLDHVRVFNTVQINFSIISI